MKLWSLATNGLDVFSSGVYPETQGLCQGSPPLPASPLTPLTNREMQITRLSGRLLNDGVQVTKPVSTDPIDTIQGMFLANAIFWLYHVQALTSKYAS